jgi:exosortase/archaeosortase
MVRVFYGITLVMTAIAAMVLVFGLGAAKSAPQEAAAAALAIALAVIPYVFTRSVQLSIDYTQRRRHEERVIDLLAEANRLARERT